MKLQSQFVFGLFYRLFMGLFMGLFFSSNLVFAQNTSTLSAPENKFREVIKAEEISDVITDKKLQADEGSRSKYSVKFGLSYSGPGIGDLNNKNQPNPDGVIGNYKTKLTGSMGARYRIDSVTAVNLGTGLSTNYPLHGGKTTDTNNPYFSFDRSSRFGDLQMRNIMNLSAITNPEYVKVGEVAGIGYELNLVHKLGDSRFAAGLDSKIDYYVYDRSYHPNTDRGSAQAYLSFYPNLKYEISDKLNVNTSFAIQYYNPRELKGKLMLRNRTITERIGLGYSFRRDVYFSPYITVYPDNLRAKNSIFNLSATFSM